jgi:ribose transport system substrate-binding protein
LIFVVRIIKYAGGKEMKKTLLIAVLIAAIAGVLPVFAKPAVQGGGKVKVTLITMDSIDEHWIKLRAGAEAAAKELGNIDLTYNAPPGKVDASVQLQMVEDAITKGAHVLMLAPLHADALVPGIEKAKRAGVKVVLVDSGANTEQYDAFLYTDNAAAAATAADQLAAAIGGKGKVAIINAQAGAGTTMTRENAFKDQMKAKYPGVTIVGTQYSDGDPTKALNIARDFMTRNPDLAGIYACNEGSTTGAGNAIEQAGKTGRVKFVGFDWSANTKALVERGVLNATMVQNPYQMGYQGLRAGIGLLTGAKVPRRIDTGVTVATKANAASIK